ncbi:SIP domain-containing protein [Marinicellulosiphila megalodicopiae]|uniref:SIP domain-containing protein n=1 Tax=Marinicellulosiphila megalodicopiae TaxID=2724896 RepID=UPI003BB01650
MVADLTALPVAAVSLKKLPDHAKGFAFIQVPKKDDIQNIKVPECVQLEWVIGSYESRNVLLEK